MQFTRFSIEIGDFITLSTGTNEDINDVLENNQYKAVGIMNSSYYMHFERDSLEIGNDSISSYIYIPE